MPSSTEVERMPVHPNSLFFQEHLARYHFALPRLVRGRVLDIACGTGYGTHMFGDEPGMSVVGVDVDADSVYAARRRYADPRDRFCIASGLQLPFASSTFDSIVSLETLEHVHDDIGLLREYGRLLDDYGVCVISTPNRLYSLERGIVNPYHVREYVEDELVSVLSRVFKTVELSYQGFSHRYQDDVVGFSESIKTGKEQLPGPSRVLVQNVYQPLKAMIPVKVRSYFIRRLLHVDFPQPDPSDIVISSDHLPVISNFVAVCRQRA